MLSLLHRAHMTHFGNALHLYGVWNFWFSEELDDTTGAYLAQNVYAVKSYVLFCPLLVVVWFR